MNGVDVDVNFARNAYRRGFGRGLGRGRGPGGLGGRRFWSGEDIESICKTPGLKLRSGGRGRGLGRGRGRGPVGIPAGYKF